jgi:hypothetical protein
MKSLYGLEVQINQCLSNFFAAVFSLAASDALASAVCNNQEKLLGVRRVQVPVSTDFAKSNEKLRHIFNYIENVKQVLHLFDNIIPGDAVFCVNSDTIVGFDINIALPGCYDEMQFPSAYLNPSECCGRLLINPTANCVHLTDIDTHTHITVLPFSFSLVNAQLRLNHKANNTCEIQFWISMCVTTHVNFSKRLALDSLVRRISPNKQLTSCCVDVCKNAYEYECIHCAHVTDMHYPVCFNCLPSVHSLTTRESEEGDDCLVALNNIKQSTLIFSEIVTNGFFEVLTDEQWFRRHGGLCSHNKFRIPLTGTAFTCDLSVTRGLSSALKVSTSSNAINCSLYVKTDDRNNSVSVCCVALKDITKGSDLIRDIVFL